MCISVSAWADEVKLGHGEVKLGHGEVRSWGSYLFGGHWDRVGNGEPPQVLEQWQNDVMKLKFRFIMVSLFLLCLRAPPGAPSFNCSLILRSRWEDGGTEKLDWWVAETKLFGLISIRPERWQHCSTNRGDMWTDRVCFEGKGHCGGSLLCLVTELGYRV